MCANRELSLLVTRLQAQLADLQEEMVPDSHRLLLFVHAGLGGAPHLDDQTPGVGVLF